MWSDHFDAISIHNRIHFSAPTRKHEAGQFNRMLKYVLNKIIESVQVRAFNSKSNRFCDSTEFPHFPMLQSKQKFQNLIRKEEYPKHLTYAIDLNEIVRNVNAKKYTSGKAFVLDVAWMAHIYSAYFPGEFFLCLTLSIA